MKYITSCPECETQFLLYKEHLKAHRGKVQCGNCEHIFNAKNRVTEISDDFSSAAEYNESLEKQTFEDTNAQIEALAERPINDKLNDVLDSVPDMQDLSPNENISLFQNEPYIDNRYEDNDQTYIELSDETHAISDPIVVEDLTTDVKYKPKKSFNAWPLLLCIGLGLLAAFQGIYFSRNKIAANYPQYKPALVQACQTLNCNIELSKNLDLLTIDDSDMQEDDAHQNVIRFSSQLINNANIVQAYPKIELTLTDVEDKAVLRKQILPVEYLEKNKNINAGLAPKDEVRINLAINVDKLAVAGYRVLLVY
jgi:predicted Zn finger-like uncharacterized protein